MSSVPVSSQVFQAPVPVGGTGALEVHVVDRRHPRVLMGGHRHADLEVVYFCRGGGRHVVDTADYEIDAGDVYLIPPGQVHDLSRLAPDAAGWAIEFTPAALEGGRLGQEWRALWRISPLLRPFLGGRFGSVPARLRVPPPDRVHWTARCRSLEDEYRSMRPGRALALSAQLLLLLVDIARLADPAGPPRPNLAGDPLLAEVFALIDELWATDLHTGDIAARVGLTPAYLTTLVRERTGRPLAAWITERRMAEARTLLLTTHRSVESIAAAVGYPSPAHFSRRFHQIHGTPPGRWRRCGSTPTSGDPTPTTSGRSTVDTRA